jgi:hypothetical protein
MKERDGNSCFDSDGSLKWLALCMFSAEMLNGKLLSTKAAGIRHL